MVLTHIQFHESKSQQSDKLSGQQRVQQLSEKDRYIPTVKHFYFALFVFFNIGVFAVIFRNNYWLVDTRTERIQKMSTLQIAQRALFQREYPPKIIGLQYISQIKQLPFCLIIMPNQQYQAEDLMKSINQLKYYNYLVINKPNNIDNQNSKQNGQQNLNLNKSQSQLKQQRQQYQDSIRYQYKKYQQKVKSQCLPRSIVMFVSTPLQNQALIHLNKMYQQYDIWTIYATPLQNNFWNRLFPSNKPQNISQYAGAGASKVIGDVSPRQNLQIISFYSRIYDFLQSNDFNNTNQQYLNNQNQQISKQITALSILQLSSMHILKVDKNQICKYQQPNFFFIDMVNGNNTYVRMPYQRITKLSQDYHLNVKSYEDNRYTYQNQKEVYKRDLGDLKERNMLLAIQRQQIAYLPQQHAITRIQYQQYNKLYNIGKYQQKQKQLPFCLTVLSHNNIQNNRYLKIVQTILQQKYHNYRVIFIDDNSDDTTMQQTIKLFKQNNFPPQRITYVKNMKRKYATYNILNANYNYCRKDEIQMLVDGDDQFIGRHVLSVFNAMYQEDQNLWLVYSNYKDSNFGFGRSAKVVSDQQHVNSTTGFRQYNIKVGAIRTWRVSLIYNIPMMYHKKQDGNWLDTVYDDALAHPILELSTVKRIKYIPQILYQYNVQYGDNDDSTYEKWIYRSKVYDWVLLMPKLQKIDTLQNSVKDKQISEVFRKDYNVQYKQIQNL